MRLALDSHPLSGPFERVELLDGTRLHPTGDWNLIVSPQGFPMAISNGKTIVPWENVRLAVRPDERD